MREIKNPLPDFLFYAYGFCAWRDARRVSPLCGGWVCALKLSYPFTKHIPVVIVMSVSHVSRYAMSWMEIEATELHRYKENGLRLSYSHLRSGKYRAITINLPLVRRCAKLFFESTGHFIQRKDKNQKLKETCMFCNVRQGYDYYISKKYSYQ